MGQLYSDLIDKWMETYDLAFEKFLCLFQELVRHSYSLQRMAEYWLDGNRCKLSSWILYLVEETAIAADSAALTPRERA